MAEASMANEGDTAIAGDAWRALVDKALKGAPFDTLRTHTADGLTLEPLYRPANPVYAGRPGLGPWQVVQRVDVEEGAAQQATTDLEQGATALALTFAGAPAAHGRGLTAATLEAVDRALAGVMLNLVPLHIEAGRSARPVLATLSALFDARGQTAGELHAGLDPIGSFAATGTMLDWSVTAPRFADTVRGFQRLQVPGTVLRADGRPVFEAGGTAVQELGFALASLTASVRALDSEGLGPDVTLPLASMALSADVDQPTTIAKMRAARRLFAMVAQACGVDTPLTLHATTGARMLSWSDPQTNLLRLTVAAFAAGAGGADAITVLPFDAAGSPFARRLSRNIQLLLLEETHVDAFADPAAGSGAFEAMTDDLAERAWAEFQRLERAGIIGHVESGALASEVAESVKAREAAIQSGERTLIGVTKHPPGTPTAARPAVATAPAATAVPVDTPDFGALVTGAAAGATLADLVAAGGPSPTVSAPPLTPRRDAARFEDE